MEEERRVQIYNMRKKENHYAVCCTHTPDISASCGYVNLSSVNAYTEVSTAHIVWGVAW